MFDTSTSLIIINETPGNRVFQKKIENNVVPMSAFEVNCGCSEKNRENLVVLFMKTPFTDDG